MATDDPESGRDKPGTVAVTVIGFPGTQQERDDLFSAVARNCACNARSGVVETNPCPPHDLLLREPTLKRLVFYRRWRSALRRGEWLEEPRWVVDG